MVKVNIGNHCYYLNGFLKGNLDGMKKVIEDNWDFVFVVDGREGVGKSIFCQQIALYLDPTFNLDRIVFSPDKFIKAIDEAQKYQAIIYDGTIAGMYAPEARTAVASMIDKKLAQCRQKNLFIFVLLPTFFYLKKTTAIFRSTCLINVYDNAYKRGNFAFWDYNRKKDLFMRGVKYYDYRCVKANFIGDFGKYEPFGSDYEAKKLKALKEEAPQLTRREKMFNSLVYYIYNEGIVSQAKIAEYSGCSRQNIQHICKTYVDLSSTSKPNTPNVCFSGGD